MEKIKKMDVKEFREKGYLQELNRQFLHPLGLALEVRINKDGTEELGGIWDYREDAEGIYFNLKNSSKERIDRFRNNQKYIQNELNKRKEVRIKLFGEVIEPIPNKE